MTTKHTKSSHEEQLKSSPQSTIPTGKTAGRHTLRDSERARIRRVLGPVFYDARTGSPIYYDGSTYRNGDWHLAPASEGFDTTDAETITDVYGEDEIEWETSR